MGTSSTPVVSMVSNTLWALCQAYSIAGRSSAGVFGYAERERVSGAFAGNEHGGLAGWADPGTVRSLRATVRRIPRSLVSWRT